MKRFLLLNAVLIALLGAAPASAAAPGDPREVDATRLRTVYQGRLVSAARLAELQRSGAATYVVYDGASARAGRAHAFDSAAAAAPWEASLLAHLRAAKFTATAEPTMLAASTCPSLTYGARLYEHSYCGGAYLGIFRTDEISHLSSYGWNDRASSLVIQDSAQCIHVVTVYTDANYGGGVKRFYGDTWSTWYNLGSFSLNDKLSSVKAVCS